MKYFLPDGSGLLQDDPTLILYAQDLTGGYDEDGNYMQLSSDSPDLNPSDI